MTADADLRSTSSLEATIHDATRAMMLGEIAKSNRTRLERLIRVTDAMLEELEIDNLKNVRRLPSAWRPRLSLLSNSLPFDSRRLLASPRTPVEALDVVFEVQARLFDIKNGQGPSRASRASRTRRRRRT